MMSLEAVNSSSRIATASGGFIETALPAVTSGRTASTMPPQATSMVLIASSEEAKTDRVQRDIGTDRDLNRARRRKHADRQQIEQRKGVFHAAILPHPAQLSIPHEGELSDICPFGV